MYFFLRNTSDRKAWFHGASKRGWKMQLAFAFHVNGEDTQGEEHFGEEWGVMAADVIPEFLWNLDRLFPMKI